MKPTAYLINTGRGGLINESDLKAALEHQTIGGAGLDVLSQEPPAADHPLIGAKNCVITPHHAWASKEARQRLMDIVLENISAFLKGEPQNVVGK
jgi:glycerate dehydrogenase